MKVALVLTGFLAGCALVRGPAVPVEARLSADVLTVRLSDGTTCRADWAVAGGAGRLDPCGPGYGYRVTEEARPNLLRQLFVDATAALGAEGAVAPMGEVVLSDGSGRDWRFVSPVPTDD